MATSKRVPLLLKLIAGDTDPIYGQLEVSLLDERNLEIIIRRKPYSGDPDVQFVLPHTSLQNILDALHEAREKLDETWLSQVAVEEPPTESDAQTT
jgi:hypothetical protein